MTPRHVRALRGTASAWIATIIAATSHTLAGGGGPSPALVAVIGVLAAPLAVLLIGRRLTALRVGATVVVAQAMFHVAFALAAGADPAVSAGHVHDRTLHAAPSFAGVVLPDAPMLLAHTVAAAATMLALYGGERMLRALGRGIRSVLRRAVEPALAPPVVLRRWAGASDPAARHGVVLSDLSRRGPPALVIAAS